MIELLENLSLEELIRRLGGELATNDNNERKGVHRPAAKSILFIDSLNFLIGRFGFTQTVGLLHALTSGKDQQHAALICIYCGGGPDNLEWRQIASVCTTVELEPCLPINGALINCTTRMRRKDGSISMKVRL